LNCYHKRLKNTTRSGTRFDSLFNWVCGKQTACFRQTTDNTLNTLLTAVTDTNEV